MSDQNLIEALISKVVNQSINELVESTIDKLVLDQAWLTKVQSIIDRKMVERVQSKLSQCDITSMIMHHIESDVTDQLKNLKKNLIVSDVEATDQTVLIKKDLTLEKGLVVSGDLVVRGQINTDGRGWKSLISVVSEQTKEKVINEIQHEVVNTSLQRIQDRGIDANSILLNGQPLISEQTIAPTVQSSSLTSVGILNSLTVKGEINLSNTVFVDSNRLGINTNTPDAALSLWDEEVAVSVGKLKDNTAYIGTNRKQNFVIVVNQQNQIEVSTDGTTTIQKLQVGKHKISHSSEAPGWLGNKGDFVFNTDYKLGSPFAWVCLGQYKWQGLLAVE